MLTLPLRTIGIRSARWFVVLLLASLLPTQTLTAQSDLVRVLVGAVAGVENPDYTELRETVEKSLQKAVETADAFGVPVQVERFDGTVNFSLDFSRNAREAGVNGYIVLEPLADRLLVRTGMLLPVEAGSEGGNDPAGINPPDGTPRDLSLVLALMDANDADMLTNLFVGAFLQTDRRLEQAQRFFQSARLAIDSTPESDQRLDNQIELYGFLGTALIEDDPRDDDNEALSQAAELFEAARQLAATSPEHQFDAEIMVDHLRKTYLFWGLSNDTVSFLEQTASILQDMLSNYDAASARDVYFAIQFRLGSVYMTMQQQTGRMDDLYHAEFAFLSALDAIRQGANDAYEAPLELNLGNIYALIEDESHRPEDFQAEVDHLTGAMRAALRENQPDRYGLAASNLGSAYMRAARNSTDPVSDLLSARSAYEEALPYMTEGRSRDIGLTNRYQLAKISWYLAQYGDREANLRAAASALDELVPLVVDDGTGGLFWQTHLLRGQAYLDLAADIAARAASGTQDLLDDSGELLQHLHDALESFSAIAGLSTADHDPLLLAAGYSKLRLVYQALADLPTQSDWHDQYLQLAIGAGESSVRLYAPHAPDETPVPYLQELAAVRKLYLDADDRRAACALGEQMLDFLRRYGTTFAQPDDVLATINGLQNDQRAACRGLS